MGGFPWFKYIFKISDFKDIVNQSVTTFYGLNDSDLLEKYWPMINDQTKQVIAPEL